MWKGIHQIQAAAAKCGRMMEPGRLVVALIWFQV
jgi:hypothetical protein